MTRNILVIDDEPNMRWVLGKALEQAGYSVSLAASGDEGLTVLGHTAIELVLLDVKLKGEDGLTVLRRLRERRSDIVVMMLTAYGTVSNAVEAMQLGAADFLRKPFDVEEIVFKVARSLERRALQQQVAQLTLAQHAHISFATLLGSAPLWQRALTHAQQLAVLDVNLLVVGEAGTGRTCLARAIHAASLRRHAPLVEADLAAYTAPAEALFGSGNGVWERAGNGTLIVRGLLAESDVVAVIATRMASDGVSPRLIIIATLEEVAGAQVHALTPGRVDVPALRDRPNDILLLAHAFAGEARLTPHAMQQLEAYTWPGNVAELAGVIQRAGVLAGAAPIDLVHLPREIAEVASFVTARGIQLPPGGINLEEVEQHLIRQALSQARGNKSKAADLLGLTRHTLLYRLEKYHIQGHDDTTPS
ncbi:MAG: sigma-54-dependent Fis family transcriptional regulator [Roseiflexaceae bacterium]|nr:sigma-54-dependent Fis family transcriptional regulator [Roseiflexaceae bacterium]